MVGLHKGETCTSCAYVYHDHWRVRIGRQAEVRASCATRASRAVGSALNGRQAAITNPHRESRVRLNRKSPLTTRCGAKPLRP